MNSVVYGNWLQRWVKETFPDLKNKKMPTKSEDLTGVFTSAWETGLFPHIAKLRFSV